MLFWKSCPWQYVRKNKRINLETRTICSYDEQKFIIPKNIDSYTKKKKKLIGFLL